MSHASCELVACHECDALYRRVPLASGARASCARCGAQLYRHVPGGTSRATALYLASLMLLLIANSYPFLTLEAGGLREQDHVVGSGLSLVAFGMAELGLVVFLTSIAFPLLVTLGTLYLLAGRAAGLVLPGMREVFRMIRLLGPWSLLTVFLLGALIAIVKLRDLATVVPGVGLFALAALVPIYTAARANLELETLWAPLGIRGLRAEELAPGEAVVACHVCGMVHRGSGPHGERCRRCRAPLHHRIPESIQRTWALLVAAAVMLVPANLLPVMTVSQLGRGEPSTIISGAIHLIEGGMWGLALIVFFASVVVPLAKLFALTFLLLSVRDGSPWRPHDRTRLYRVTEMIGAWSMVDVFLVGLLAGLVSLGVLATIEPGLGASFFGAAVILTMLAAHSFDPRLIWDHTVSEEATDE